MEWSIGKSALCHRKPERRPEENFAGKRGLFT
jgi:hypothetical protein